MSTAYNYSTWTPDLATGDAHIDDQHQQLIACLNKLFDGHKAGKGSMEVKQMMIFLVDYTAKHFADEEVMLKKHSYPQFAQHKKLHDDFCEKAKGMIQDLLTEISKKGKPTDEFITNVYTAVGKWVIGHIKGEDMKWAAYVKDKK